MDWFGSSKKKESDGYEKEFLARYNKQKKAKPKKNASKTLEPDEKKQDVETKILKKEPEPLTTKFESAKQEYSVTIKNLMDAKKVLKGVKEDIEKSNSEYADIISKIKLTRGELLKANDELRGKTVETEKTAEEYKKQSLLAQEINNSRGELSEIKDEIKKYSNELEDVKTKADNSPDVKKMKEEKEKIENEMMQKRKDLESGFREINSLKMKWLNPVRVKEQKKLLMQLVR